MIDNRLTAAELDEAIRRNRIPRISDRARAATCTGACDQVRRACVAPQACEAPEDDPLACARGVVWGIVAALMIWAALALVALTVWGAIS